MKITQAGVPFGTLSGVCCVRTEVLEDDACFGIQGLAGGREMAYPAQLAASTARSYALVGFIFYLLGAVGWAIALLGFLASMPFWIGTVPQMSFVVFPMIFPFGIFAAVSVGFAWWSWATMQLIEQGRYADARSPSLILGVFGIFIAFLIGGIFFLLAYGKLGEVLQPPMAYPPWVPPPVPAARFCTSCGRAVASDAKFCANCGKPLPA